MQCFAVYQKLSGLSRWTNVITLSFTEGNVDSFSISTKRRRTWKLRIAASSGSMFYFEKDKTRITVRLKEIQVGPTRDSKVNKFSFLIKSQ